MCKAVSGDSGRVGQTAERMAWSEQPARWSIACAPAVVGKNLRSGAVVLFGSGGVVLHARSLMRVGILYGGDCRTNR